MSRVKGRIKQGDKEGSATVGLPIRHEPYDVDKSLPVFSLRYLQKGYCLDRCQKHERVVFVDRLFRLSQMPWDEIRKSDKHGFGTEKIARSTIKAPIPKHVTQDVDLTVSRSYFKVSMASYKVGATSYVL